MSKTTRVTARMGFTQDVRVTLLESDLDTQDEMLAELHNDLKAIKNVLIGMLVSLATASILLAINLTTG